MESLFARCGYIVGHRKRSSWKLALRCIYCEYETSVFLNFKQHLHESHEADLQLSDQEYTLINELLARQDAPSGSSETDSQPEVDGAIGGTTESEVKGTQTVKHVTKEIQTVENKAKETQTVKQLTKESQTVDENELKESQIVENEVKESQTVDENEVKESQTVDENEVKENQAIEENGDDDKVNP